MLLVKPRLVFFFIAILIFAFTYYLTDIQLRDHRNNFHSTSATDADDTFKTDKSFKAVPYKRWNPQCGTGEWQRNYAKLHRDMMKKPLKDQRITIMDAFRNGAGDRLTMIATAFFHALLSGRAFKIKWSGADLFEALDPNGIDWRYSNDDDEESHGIVDIQDHMTYYVGYDNFQINHIYSKGNLSAIGNDTARTVVWRLNQGQIWSLFDNNLYHEQLYLWGLRPETAFGCVVDFLFKLRRETIDVLKTEYQQILGVDDPYTHLIEGKRWMPSYHNSRPLTIALQIRFGDQAISSQDTCKGSYHSDAWVKKFFSCSDEIASDLPGNSKDIKLVLLTDCEDLRKVASEHLGDKLITRTNYTESHIEHIDKTQDIQSLRYTIGELFLLSFTDYQIISSESSFGKVGALISMKWHEMFALSNWSKDKSLLTSCKLHNYLQWREYSRQWIRV